MDKLKTHLFLLILDIAAFFSCFYVYSQYVKISREIINTEDSISFQSPLGLYIILAVIPIIHISSFIKAGKQARRFFNFAVIIIFVALILTAYDIDRKIENNLQKSNYTYCAEKSEKMRLSEFKLYLRDIKKCSE